MGSGGGIIIGGGIDSGGAKGSCDGAAFGGGRNDSVDCFSGASFSGDGSSGRNGGQPAAESRPFRSPCTDRGALHRCFNFSFSKEFYF